MDFYFVVLYLSPKINTELKISFKLKHHDEYLEGSSAMYCHLFLAGLYSICGFYDFCGQIDSSGKGTACR